MFSLTRGRALATLVLALAAVMAVTPVLTASADTGAAAAGKKSCKKGKKGKAKGSAAKGCKKGKAKAKKPSSSAPKPGTRLTGTNTLVAVGLQYPGEILIASVSINSIPATCSDGTTKPIVGSALAPIKGMSFSGSKDYSGGYSVTISGTFSSATKVSGTLSMTPLTFPNGVTCTVPPQQFMASK